MPQQPRLWSFRTSPYSGKVRAAFAEKGIDLELAEVHPAKRPSRLRELNPANRVPVLELADGTGIRESTVICDWLEETHPEPALWPSNPDVRGWARGIARHIDDNIVGSYFLGMRKLAFGASDDDPEDIVERLHERYTRRLPELETALGRHDGPWLSGEQFTYADLCGMPIAVRVPEWTPALVPDPESLPLTTAWFEALRERPSSAQIDTGGETRVTD